MYANELFMPSVSSDSSVCIIIFVASSSLVKLYTDPLMSKISTKNKKMIDFKLF